MLLKSGHRHVYMSRKFAIKHGFVPQDAVPGSYGYGGLVSIGEWPVTLTPSASSPEPEYHDDIHGPGAGYLPANPTLAASQSTQNLGVNMPSSVSMRSHSPYSSPRMDTINLLAPPQTSHFHPHGGGGARGQQQQPGMKSNASIRSQHSKRSSMRPKKPNPNEATAPDNGLKPVMIEVYLSEEPHFDVVLGRSFFEKRGIKINSVDPTDVWCLDTGEKIECELVVLKDGRGEIVTVT